MSANGSTTPPEPTDAANSLPSTMQAMIRREYGAPDSLRVATGPVPEPAPGEVLVRVLGAGIDAGTWHLITGTPYLMRLMGFGLLVPRNPVPGLAFSGQVVAIGSAVSHLRVGDVVMGTAQGAFAEYLVVAEEKVRPIPRTLDPVHAAALPISGNTALEAIREADVSAGDRVLVLGAGGGVGHFAVQLAVARGATVTGVSSAGKSEFVLSLGAADVINYAEADVTTLDREWDVIIDTAGNRPLRALRQILSRTGTLVIVGGEHGGAILGGTERSLAASAASSFTRQRLRGLISRENPVDYEALASLVDEGAITPRVDRTFALAEASAAIEYMRSGAVRGKVILQVGKPQVAGL